MVLCMTTSLTVMLETQALVLSFPSPPMLMPWPGPQFTLWMFTLVHPVCMDTQSSPAHAHKTRVFGEIVPHTNFTQKQVTNLHPRTGRALGSSKFYQVGRSQDNAGSWAKWPEKGVEYSVLVCVIGSLCQEMVLMSFAKIGLR